MPGPELVSPSERNTVDFSELSESALLAGFETEAEGIDRARFVRHSSFPNALSDAKIGEKAFNNPPNNLDDDKKSEVRESVEAASKDDLDAKADQSDVDTKADQSEVDTIQTALTAKADQSDVDTKADQSEVDTIQTALTAKADQSDVDTIQTSLTTLGTKLDAVEDTNILESVEGVNNSNKALGATDIGKVFSIDTSNLDRTLTLPETAKNGDTVGVIKSDVGTGRLSVEAFGGGSIVNLDYQYESAILMYDGVTWVSVSRSVSDIISVNSLPNVNRYKLGKIFVLRNLVGSNDPGVYELSLDVESYYEGDVTDSNYAVQSFQLSHLNHNPNGSLFLLEWEKVDDLIAIFFRDSYTGTRPENVYLECTHWSADSTPIENSDILSDTDRLKSRVGLEKSGATNFNSFGYEARMASAQADFYHKLNSGKVRFRIYRDEAFSQDFITQSERYWKPITIRHVSVGAINAESLAASVISRLLPDFPANNDRHGKALTFIANALGWVKPKISFAAKWDNSLTIPSYGRNTANASAPGIRVGTSSQHIIDENETYNLVVKPRGNSEVGSVSMIVTGAQLLTVSGFTNGFEHTMRESNTSSILFWTNESKHLYIAGVDVGNSATVNVFISVMEVT